MAAQTQQAVDAVSTVLPARKGSPAATCTFGFALSGWAV